MAHFQKSSEEQIAKLQKLHEKELARKEQELTKKLQTREREFQEQMKVALVSAYFFFSALDILLRVTKLSSSHRCIPVRGQTTGSLDVWV